MYLLYRNYIRRLVSTNFHWGVSALSETPIVLFPACSMNFPFSQQRETNLRLEERNQLSFALFFFHSVMDIHEQPRTSTCPLLGSRTLVYLLLCCDSFVSRRRKKNKFPLTKPWHKDFKWGQTPSPVPVCQSHLPTPFQTCLHLLWCDRLCGLVWETHMKLWYAHQQAVKWH